MRPLLAPSLLALSVDSLWRRCLVDPDRLAAYLDSDAHLNRAGTAPLRAIASARTGTNPPGSDLETLFLECIRRYRLPSPETQYRIETPDGTKFIDAAYPGHRVAIELDGFTTRFADAERFERDHIRQNDVEALGWTFRRFTWRQVTLDPASVAVRVGRAIGLEPCRWRAIGRPATHA